MWLGFDPLLGESDLQGDEAPLVHAPVARNPVSKQAELMTDGDDHIAPYSGGSRLQLIKARAVERALPVSEESEGLVLNLPWGEVHALKERDGLRLTLRASEMANSCFFSRSVQATLVNWLPDPS